MKYRVLETLAYGDTFPPEIQGTIWARPGEIVDLPTELAQEPERVQKLIELGLIEPIPEVKIHKPKLDKVEEKPAE